MPLFEPASQNPNFDILYQQYLARQKNTEDLLAVVGDNSSLEGTFETLEDVVVALVSAVGKLNTVVNTTSESSDYDLSVGETAVINITAASTPLNIAVEDGVYELELLFESSTFGADQDIDLQANNTTYVGEFGRISLIADTAIATDEVDTVIADMDSYELAVGSRPRVITARLVISGNISGMRVGSYGVTAASRRIRETYIWRDGSVAHTSLGTLSIGEAATGVMYVHRVA